MLMIRSQLRIAASFLLSVVQASSAQQKFVAVDAPDTPHDGTSWRRAFLTLHEGLAAAGQGGEVWVAQGTYFPDTSNPNEWFCADCPQATQAHATFLIRDGQKIYGGFDGADPSDPNSTGEIVLSQRDEVRNPTILSGDVNQTPTDHFDDVYHVVTALNVNDTTKLSGFIIEYGNAGDDPISVNVYESVGGGLLIVGTSIQGQSQESKLVVTRCVFRENWSSAGGGGVAIVWPTASGESTPARIVNCTFDDNVASRNFGEFRTGTGGGLWVQSAALELTNSVFINNTAELAGRAVYAKLEATGHMTNNTFSRNKAPAGAAVFAATADLLPLNNSICWADGSLLDPNDPPVVLEVYDTIDASYCDIEYFANIIYPSISYPGSNINIDP